MYKQQMGTCLDRTKTNHQSIFTAITLPATTVTIILIIFTITSITIQTTFLEEAFIATFSFFSSLSWAATHTHTQQKASTKCTYEHMHDDIKTHIACSLKWQGHSHIVLSASIPDGYAVLSVYLAPGHPWDSLSAFSPLPKTCSPVYHLIDSQRKAKIDSVAPTSLKSFLAKQTLYALTC